MRHFQQKPIDPEQLARFIDAAHKGRRALASCSHGGLSESLTRSCDNECMRMSIRSE
jgi:hypothetical protein